MSSAAQRLRSLIAPPRQRPPLAPGPPLGKRSLSPSPRPPLLEPSQEISRRLLPPTKRATSFIDGKTLARHLKALRIDDIELALLCVPSGYFDCRYALTRIGAAQEEDCRRLWALEKTGNVEAMDKQAKPLSCHPHANWYEAPWKHYWEHVRQLRIELRDADGRLAYLSQFGGWALREQPSTGPILILAALRQFGSRPFLTSSAPVPADAAGRVFPLYTQPDSQTQGDVIRKMVELALLSESSARRCIEALTRSTLMSEAQMLAVLNGQDATFSSVEQFFRVMHAPDSPEMAERARTAARRLAIQGIIHSARVINARPPCAQAPISVDSTVVNSLIDAQPETLTTDQIGVIWALVNSLRSPSPTNALLSGDVGTGKTLAFGIPAVAAHLAGAKVAMIAPTEILANQLHASLVQRFTQARIERVLTGRKIQDLCAILVGTSGLTTQAQKQSFVPDLLIVDEQHKLDTGTRSVLRGPGTHTIEASATPIPRSLASSLFAGMQVFNLYQAPVARDIETHLVEESQRAQTVRWLREVIAAGHRAAIIYPRVESQEKANETSGVKQSLQALQEHFPGRVAHLHGKLKSVDIDAELSHFRSGAKPLLVSTTIVETGIDVPDVRLMIIKEADRFGASALHQLRGRLARNGGHARFVMMCKDLDALAPETLERLRAVEGTSDGYALAEADMRARGFGDLSGSSQAGNISCAFRMLRLDFDELAQHPIQNN